MLFGLVVLCSCGLTSEDRASKNVDAGNIPFDKATHFEYRKHQYIKFSEGWMKYQRAGVVHDPDCKYCHE